MMFFDTLLHYADFHHQTLVRLSNYQTISAQLQAFVL